MSLSTSWSSNFQIIILSTTGLVCYSFSIWCVFIECLTVINFGTVYFIWKLPLNKEDEDNTANGRAIMKVANLMPEFHLRQMHCDFTEKYKNAAKSTNKSLMHFMYQDL